MFEINYIKMVYIQDCQDIYQGSIAVRYTKVVLHYCYNSYFILKLYYIMQKLLL